MPGPATRRGGWGSNRHPRLALEQRRARRGPPRVPALETGRIPRGIPRSLFLQFILGRGKPGGNVPDDAWTQRGRVARILVGHAGTPAPRLAEHRMRTDDLDFQLPPE